MHNLNVYVTNDCNLDCSFCIRKVEPPPSRQDHAAILKAIETFEGPLGTFAVTGGEPLLEKEFVKTLFRLAAPRSQFFSITTNGHFLDDDLVEFFNSYNAKVIISLQGLTGEKSLDQIPHLGNWIARVKRLKRPYISYIIPENFSYETLITLHALFNCNVGVSFDLTKPYTQEMKSRFEYQLRKLVEIDPTSSSWVTFRHSTECDYNYVSIFPDGSQSLICHPIPGLLHTCRGYLGIMPLSEYYNYLDFISKFQHSFQRDIIIPTFQILTNLTCNLDCTYCYEKKNLQINNLQLVQNYLLAKFKTTEADKVVIDLIGGESFLLPEMCDSIIEYAVMLGVRYHKKVIVSTTTNGTTLSNPKVKALITKYRDILNIGVSIDGTQDNHNKCRVYKGGRGSYDDAVANLAFLFTTLPKSQIGVKATFTTETFMASYVDGVINLIKLGFTEIAGNIVFEEIIPKSLTQPLFDKFKQVIDYLFNHDLEQTVRIFQYTPEAVRDYLPHYTEEDLRSWCGSSNHMSCLGLDGKVYGCNRFCTMDKPNMHIGVVAGDNVQIVNQQLVNETTGFKSEWGDDCTECILKRECPSCVAATYEVEDRAAYIRENRMCGWTHAVSMAKLYFRLKMLEKDKKISDLIASEPPTTH